jgi:putative salt-induced outer membrane protein YdiY
MLLGAALLCAITGVRAWAETPATDASPTNAAWTRTLSFGSSANEGNSETTRYRLGLLAEQGQAPNEWRIEAEGVYGETDDEKSTEYAQGSVDYRRLVTERRYYLLRLQAGYDAVADVDYRFIAGPGIGYYFVKNAAWRVSGETGPSYVWQKLGGEEEDYAVWRFAERIEWDCTENLQLWEFAEYLPRVDDTDQYLFNAEVGLRSLLYKRLSVRLSAGIRVNSEPAEDKRESDIHFATALDYVF